jgi:IPT/TIG domain
MSLKYKVVSLWIVIFVLAGALTVFIAVPGLKSPDTVTSATVAPPSITSIFPTSGPVGTVVTINGSVFGTSRGTSYVTFGSAKAANYPSWTSTKIQATVPSGAQTGQVTVTTTGGTSNSRTFTVTTEPAPPAPNPPTPAVATPTWYLAEGTTDYGFETYIAIENPNASTVTAQVTYMTKSGPKARGALWLPAMSQTIINPKDDLGATDFSTKVECKEGKTIAVDRRMVWLGAGAPTAEGHASIGVTAPAKKWYLAEGSSKWGFETWLLIQNPNSSQANCAVTYMIEGESPVKVDKTVPANSRASFNMETDIGQKDASIKVESNVPVIPERAMYRNNRREGHDSIGTTTPARSYYLAEGTTDWGFTTYVLVQNPNNAENTINFTYMTPTGTASQPSFVMAANSRKTIRVNDVVPGKDLSTRVQGSLPLIAERAMYWGEGTTSGEACHDSIGMASPHKTFYLPDGETLEGYETWTLVQNPNATDVLVDIYYLTPTGTGNVVFQDTVPGNSRRSYNMADKIPSGMAAILVTSRTTGKKIMVERAMYWNSRGLGMDTIGGFSD